MQKSMDPEGIPDFSVASRGGYPSSGLGSVVAILVVGGLLACAELAEAKTLVVSNTGCSSSGQPYCKIGQALSQAGPGDIVQVQAGTYKEQVVIEVSGTSGSPIVVEAAPGAKPVIDGSGLDHWEEGLIQVNNQSHLVLRGLTVRNSSYYCVAVSNSSHVVVEKMLVDGCEHGGILFDNGSSDVKALDNEVKGTDQCGEDCGTHEAITFSEVSGFEASGNHVHDGVKEGIDAKDASDNGTIHDNTVADMGQVGIYLNHATNVKIYGNKVHDTGSSGIQIAVGDLAMGGNQTANNAIYQNEVWGNAYCGLEFWAEGSGTMNNNKIYNNVFHANGHYGIQLSDDSDQSYGNVIRNNIISKNELGGISGDAKDANTISHNLFFDTGETAGSAKVTGNPMFANPTGGDFEVQAGSPAIDKGYDMGLPKVGKPDIGPHEYGYTPPPPSNPPDDGGGTDPPEEPGQGPGTPGPSGSTLSPQQPGQGQPQQGPEVNLVTGGCSLSGGASSMPCSLVLALTLLAIALLGRRRRRS